MSYIGSSAAPLPVAFSAAQAESFSGTGVPEQVTTIANVVWTTEVVAAYEAQLAAQAAAMQPAEE